MQTYNLLAIYQGGEALYSTEMYKKDVERAIHLKPQEVQCIRELSTKMLNSSPRIDIAIFEGYYVGYKIPQINKEFDLLRFSDGEVINIELKSDVDLNNDERREKVLKQARMNYYYLRALKRKVNIFVYIQFDSLYEYDESRDQLFPLEIKELTRLIFRQGLGKTIDIDMEFAPSQFFVSPFNSTNRFVNGQYFLTEDQQKKENSIIEGICDGRFRYYTISANAGTGKTLLIYDIAKKIQHDGFPVLIIHCGALNIGQNNLIDRYGWKIISIRDIKVFTVESIIKDYKLIVIDESHRINHYQLELIINVSKKQTIPILFSFDVKQFLKDGEITDINQYLSVHHPDIEIATHSLTNKIRTNKNLASFITNMFSIGKSNEALNYQCVTVDYFFDVGLLQLYLKYLDCNEWKVITFTNSRYNVDPLDFLSSLSETKAHDVIGQEFPKVALVLDENFFYINNKLFGKDGYYSAGGMLYQILTRVINELKIIVFNNPPLFQKLLEIKQVGQT